MAITVTPGTYYEYRKQLGYIDLVNDTLKAALMDQSFSGAFDRDKHKAFTAPEWQANTSYSEGDTVIPTTTDDYYTGYIMLCIDHGSDSGSDGQSGSSEPSWPDDAADPFGNTVMDGDLTWEVWSYDCAIEEISDAGGYARQTLTLSDADSGQTEDEANDLSYVAYDDIVFPADETGDFDPTSGCVIYDDSDPQKTVIAGVEFGATYTVVSGTNMRLKGAKAQDESVQTTV